MQNGYVLAGRISNWRHPERKRYPKGVELHALTVTLDYKGKRFATVDFEATPDLEGHAPNTVRDMDDGTVELFTELGF